MKVTGLFYKKLNEEFDEFCQVKYGKPSDKLSKEEATSTIVEYEETVIHDSVAAMMEHHPYQFNTQTKHAYQLPAHIQHSLSYYGAYVHFSDQLFESIRVYIHGHKEEKTNKLIIAQYGMLVRLADQVGTLLGNGYPDGALRIYRTFYENAILLLFFIRHADNLQLPIRFIDYSNRIQKKKVDSLQKNLEALKWRVPDTKDVERINNNIEKYKTKYGKEFLGDEYGWANDIIVLPRKINFRDIEEHIELTKFRPFYIWASGYTHAGFESLSDFLDDEKPLLVLNRITEKVIAAKSYLDPMQFTIALFDEVNISILQLYSDKSEFEINRLSFRRIFEKMLATFDHLG